MQQQISIIMKCCLIIMTMQYVYCNSNICDNDNLLSSYEYTINKYREEIKIKDALIEEYKEVIDRYKIDIDKYKSEISNNMILIDNFKFELDSYKIKSNEDDDCKRELNMERNNIISQEWEYNVCQRKLRAVVYGYKVFRKLYEIRVLEMSAYRLGWYNIYHTAAIYADINEYECNQALDHRYMSDMTLSEDIDRYIITIDNLMDAEKIHQQSIEDEYVT